MPPAQSGLLWRGLEASRGGASWAAGEAQEGALGGQGSLFSFFERAPKVILERLGSLLGTSWRLLGRFWGGPGSLREVIFFRFCESCSPRGKI